MPVIRKAFNDDISVIRELALRIWPKAYGHILSAAQLEYMLELIYSVPSLQNQMIKKGHQFIIVSDAEKYLGFASYSPTPVTRLFRLHKLYVLTNEQKKGLGTLLLQYVLDDIINTGGNALELNVNRHNSAKAFYEKLGFIVDREEDIDIGNGYYMNDYVMYKGNLR